MTRWMRWSGLLLAVLHVLPFASATHPAEVKKKFRTVTKTFSNNGQVAIPATGTDGPANPYPATVNVGGFKKGKIKDVTLILNGFTQLLTRDVDVLLVAPNGLNAFAQGDVGNNDPVSGLNLRLDDQAAAPLPTYPSPLSSGTFRPTNFEDTTGPDTFPAPAPIPGGNVALSVFDGGNPNGTWKLFVHDDSSGDVGSFDGGFALEITAKVKKK